MEFFGGAGGVINMPVLRLDPRCWDGLPYESTKLSCQVGASSTFLASGQPEASLGQELATTLVGLGRIWGLLWYGLCRLRSAVMLE